MSTCENCGGQVDTWTPISVTACVGNHVVLLDPGTGEVPDLVDVAMWALVEHSHGGFRHVHPQICIGGEIVDAHELPNYVGVATSKDADEIGSDLLVGHRKMVTEIHQAVAAHSKVRERELA